MSKEYQGKILSGATVSTFLSLLKKRPKSKNMPPKLIKIIKC